MRFPPARNLIDMSQQEKFSPGTSSPRAPLSLRLAGMFLGAGLGVFCGVPTSIFVFGQLWHLLAVVFASVGGGMMGVMFPKPTLRAFEFVLHLLTLSS